MAILKIDAERLWRRIMELSEFTEPNRPWTRLAFGENHRRCREWVRAQMAEAGLSVGVDPGGNMIGTREGRRKGLPAIACGSHSDTVPNGGRFDGAAGLAAAVEIASALADNDVELDHSLEVIDFLAEEPNEFGTSCVGSRAVAGELTESALALESPEGETLASAINAMGGDSAKLRGPLRGKRDTAAFFELHIEQGPVLEQTCVDVGLVTDFVGIDRYRLKVSGEAAHAGTTPMDRRRDALVGAAELVLEARRLAEHLNAGDTYLVATVGKLAVRPNGSNVVPGSVDFVLEMRSNRREAAREFEKEFFRFAEESCAGAGLMFESERSSSVQPVRTNEKMLSLLRNAATAAECTFREMSSGAGHDAAHMAFVCPSGMVFVPCRGGRSHCPEEWAEKEQIARGAQVMLEAILLCDARELDG